MRKMIFIGLIIGATSALADMEVCLLFNEDVANRALELVQKAETVDRWHHGIEAAEYVDEKLKVEKVEIQKTNGRFQLMINDRVEDLDYIYVDGKSLSLLAKCPEAYYDGTPFELGGAPAHTSEPISDGLRTIMESP